MSFSPWQRLWRGAYACVMYALAPVLLYHLVWKGLGDRAYFRRWGERFGWYGEPALPATIWIHAVSVGEVIAAAPLVDALRARHPESHMLVTTTTPTGAAQVASRWQGAVAHRYLPFDLRGAARRFLAHARPRIGIVMETEIWPNLYVETARVDVPLLLVNARLSQRSLRGYAPVRPLIGMALACVDAIAAQSQADGERFVQAGAVRERVQVSGNIKFDLALPAGLDTQARERRVSWGAARPVWIAASTHEGEEGFVIAAHARLRERFPDLLLLWAPRHPARFPAAIAACRQRGWRTATRSAQTLAAAETDCFVIDSLGELLGFYACADVAFVGGSVQAIGGHNVLEPAALGVPAVVGPHTANFVEATALLHAAGALLQADDGDGVVNALSQLLADPGRRHAMGDAGRALVASQRGALARTLDLVEAERVKSERVKSRPPLTG
ncbi:MAG: lipid IV(A) 3-deoxy-D-manno-octulosonic acid transferase [Proteobacteria bacterium]|nr:lipid IV(A) 3-deoxy-D-manno-octulosonic acid transferase [Pseudomonadota bacterium]MBS0463489.1 lipid IV(A) 3-deoxy-D-manno-octulosonic acid transferase [Pseudomonadota bacterium]